MSSRPADTWARGDLYEPYVGRWSRLVAREFLDWLRARPGLDWLDVGCGTGALAQTILAAGSPRAVLGVDASEGFVAHATRTTGDGRAAFRVGDARALPVATGSVDLAVSGLVLNFVPDPPAAVAEMARAVRGGGTVAAYVWDYAGRMELMRRFWDAAAALDPAAAELDEGRRFPLAHPDRLAALFTGAGLQAVATRAIDVPTVFRDFDDYWTPFLGGQGPAPGYCRGLPEDRRAALRERLRQALPAGPDGRIALTARAWAVRGSPPP